jgi:hypothetical protein
VVEEDGSAALCIAVEVIYGAPAPARIGVRRLECPAMTSECRASLMSVTAHLSIAHLLINTTHAK